MDAAEIEMRHKQRNGVFQVFHLFRVSKRATGQADAYFRVEIIEGAENLRLGFFRIV